MENQKSLRGMILENILKSFIEENLFETINGLKEKLQEHLNTNLNFETNVVDVEMENNIIMGRVYFKDENMVTNRVIGFTITPKHIDL